MSPVRLISRQTSYSAEHREERRRVLEVGGDDAVAGGFVAVDDGDERPVVVVVGERELAHGEHVRLAVELALDERDRPPRRAGERVRRRRLVVGRELARDRRRRCRASPATRKRSTCGYGSRPSRSAAFSASAAGNEEPSNGAAAVLSSVSSLPGARSEKSTSRSARSAEASTSPSAGTGTGLRSSPWSVPICVDPLELGAAVAQQDEPVGAGVGAVEHAEAVGRRLHVEDRPDLAVHDRERREGLHHLRVGLVDEPAGQPPVLVEVEVAVLDQQRHLERRSFRQLELALALVTHDPEPREPGVDVELGDAHDVVVVPEQRRPLVHRVVEDGGLARGEEVLGPAVVRGGREAAVQVDDGVAGQRRPRARSGAPPLRPGTHCTGTPSASVGSGATVSTTGNGPRSSLRHSTVTGCPRSASIVGPGTVPSKPQTLEAGRSRWKRCSPARMRTVSRPSCSAAMQP